MSVICNACQCRRRWSAATRRRLPANPRWQRVSHPQSGLQPPAVGSWPSTTTFEMPHALTGYHWAQAEPNLNTKCGIAWGVVAAKSSGGPHQCQAIRQIERHTGKPTGVAVSRCINWFQTQPILTTCHIRYHSHRRTGQL